MPDNSAYTLWAKNFFEIALSLTVFFLLVKRIFAFYTEFQDGHQKWRENDFFGKKWQMTLHIPWGPKLSTKLLYLASFLRLMYLTFYAEIHDGRQIWWKIIFFGKSAR